jgi:hypothetical protein
MKEWLKLSDEKKQNDPLPNDKRQETFLPPLKMILAFFDKESRQGEKRKKDLKEKEKTVEKNLEKLIEKLSEKDE